MTSAVSILGLTKVFPKVRALDDLTFDIPTGSLFGVLGRNGAGKTTLFSIAAGFLRASAGTIQVLGQDVREISTLRGRFSMLPQDAAFQGGVPVLDQLVMFGRLNGYGVGEAERRSREALDLVGLADIATKKARHLSHGMLKRVALCQAFLGRPEVIFLDEPTAGLDPETARHIRNLIQAWRENRTIIFSSHYLREVQELCSHAAILDEGRLVACASMAELTSAGVVLRLRLGAPLPPLAAAALESLPFVSALTSDVDGAVDLELDLRGEPKDDAFRRIALLLLVDHRLTILEMHEGASLEERFLALTR